jgi:uncharacterized protein (TIGR02145 family)
MKKKLLIFTAVVITASLFAQDSISDFEGNKYFIKTIGTQTWTIDNLKSTKLNDGTTIPVCDDATWATLTTPGLGWQNNDTSNKSLGGYYNWFAVNTLKLCPTGWHVPSAAEWTTLADQYGGLGVCTPFLQTAGGGTNSSGFSILLLGARSYNTGSWQYIDVISRFWASDENSTDYGTEIGTYNNSTNMTISGWYKNNGHNIRCIKDVTSQIDNFTVSGISVNAYPNPVTTELKLKVDNIQSKNFSYQLFDLSGRQIAHNPILAEETIISFKNLAGSVYLLKVTDGKSATKSITIVKK